MREPHPIDSLEGRSSSIEATLSALASRMADLESAGYATETWVSDSFATVASIQALSDTVTGLQDELATLGDTVSDLALSTDGVDALLDYLYVDANNDVVVEGANLIVDCSVLTRVSASPRLRVNRGGGKRIATDQPRPGGARAAPGRGRDLTRRDDRDQGQVL